MSNFKFQLSLDIKPYSEALRTVIQLTKISSGNINEILKDVETELNT